LVERQRGLGFPVSFLYVVSKQAFQNIGQTSVLSHCKRTYLRLANFSRKSVYR
jgi:hypothetical protein